MNKWLRRLWLVNGVIVLVGGSLFTYQLTRSLLRSRADERGPMVGERLQRAISDTLALQDISMTLPKSIGNTDYRFVQLTARDLTEPTQRVMAAHLRSVSEFRVPDYAYETNALTEQGTINLLFLKADGSDPHLLLERKGYVATADIAGERDSLQTFNIYRLVFHDSDGDGRLTRLDRANLFCSTLNGADLRQVTTDSLRVVRYTKSLSENRLYIQARIRPADMKIPEADWRERIFVYDVASDRLSPFINDTEVLNKATAFQAASELVFGGLERPNGYTESVLTAARRSVKA